MSFYSLGFAGGMGDFFKDQTFQQFADFFSGGAGPGGMGGRGSEDIHVSIYFTLYRIFSLSLCSHYVCVCVCVCVLISQLYSK